MPEAIYTLLPAFNEEQALRKLIPDLLQALKPLNVPFTICVVDDGSSDGTAVLGQSYSPQEVRVIHHDINRGYGAAIKTGALWVIQNAQADDVVITLDADNTHPPAFIPILVNKIREGYDAVTASYTVPGGKAYGVQGIRRLFSWGANTLLRWHFRFPGAGTYTNGFRAYRVGILQEAYKKYGDRLVEETNFAGGTELFVKSARGKRVGEIPFELHYENRGTDSKINIPKTIAGYLKLLRF